MTDLQAKYRLKQGKVVSIDFSQPLMLKPDPIPYRVIFSSRRKDQLQERRSNVVKFPSASERSR